MCRARFILRWMAVTAFIAVVEPAALAFEGRIHAVVIQGTETMPLLYTVGTNFLRIEVDVTNSDKSRAGWPNPVDIVDLQSGALTLLFPHNRSFVRLAVAENSSAPVQGAPALPMPPGGLPPGVGPQPQNGAVTGVPAMPAMPPTLMMPRKMMEMMELKATGKKEKIFSYACEQYELKQRGETLEIWATDQLLPYQPYLRNQPHRFGPRMLEERWPELLKARKLFPLRVGLRFDNGPNSPRDESVSPRRPDRTGGTERFRFEVKSVTPEKIADNDGKLFQQPPDYIEIQPLPF